MPVATHVVEHVAIKHGVCIRPVPLRRIDPDTGVPGLTPHDLRHTAASLAVQAGANVKAVQRMLGHASAAVTLDVYAGLFGDELDAVADRLDEAAVRARADSVRTGSNLRPISGTEEHGEKCRLTCANVRWGGRDSNPRPRDYESPALTG